MCCFLGDANASLFLLNNNCIKYLIQGIEQIGINQFFSPEYTMDDISLMGVQI